MTQSAEFAHGPELSEEEVCAAQGVLGESQDPTGDTLLSMPPTGASQEPGNIPKVYDTPPKESVSSGVSGVKTQSEAERRLRLFLSKGKQRNKIMIQRHSVSYREIKVVDLVDAISLCPDSQVAKIYGEVIKKRPGSSTVFVDETDLRSLLEGKSIAMTEVMDPNSGRLSVKKVLT